jgi:hypothetical protein
VKQAPLGVVIASVNLHCEYLNRGDNRKKQSGSARKVPEGILLVIPKKLGVIAKKEGTLC